MPGLTIPGLRIASAEIDVTTTGSQSITGVGFKPKGIIFITQGDSGSADAAGKGLADADLNMFSSWFERKSDGATSSGDSATSIKFGGSDAGYTTFGEFTVTSMDSDGFTVNVSTADSGAKCEVLCFG